jgi:hypothetical protein
MKDFGMSCEGCSFEEGTSCSIGILENIKQESNTCEIVDGHYQFNRVCPHKNTDGLTKEQSFEKNKLPISFIVLDDNLEKTQGIIDKILSVTKGERAYSVCIVTTDNFKSLKGLADKHHNFYVLKSFSETKKDRIRDAFSKVKNGYSIILDSNENIEQDHIDNLNSFVNKKMKRLGLVSDSPVVINNAIFKYLKGDKVVCYQDKLSQMCEEQESVKMIHTWEEINEAVNI